MAEQGLELERNPTEPTQPAVGFTRLYVDADGNLAFKRQNGSVGKVRGGGAINLNGYVLTLAADSTLGGTLTGGGEVQAGVGVIGQFLRSGVAMLRGSNSVAGRVPVFGSNTDVLDGDAGLSYDAANDRLTASGGVIGAQVQLTEGSTPNAVTNATVVFVDAGGDLCWRKDGGQVVKLAAAGTYTLTIPATGTAALLGTAQTFSAAQTFSNVLTAPGMKPASNSTTAVQIQDAAGTAILTVDTTNDRVSISDAAPIAKLTMKATSLPTDPITSLASLGSDYILLQADAESADAKTGLAVRFNSTPGIGAGIVMGRYGSSWGTFVALHTHGNNADVLDELTERLRVTGDSLETNSIFVQLTEMTAPSAGAANTARLFAQDNGSGKTQLCVRFASGAIQVLATEP